MVVLSSAILSRNGKVLVARQFVPMNKLRIEGLLAAFPKLVGGGGGGQHTFIETENVRYLYQPIEQLYALLVTNKQSNIMEDLETLRLVAKLIPEYCHGQDEDAVIAQAFALVYALDEVISMGYRENLTLQQVRTFTEMDSHEEKLQNIIQDSKAKEAAQKAKEHAKEIAKRKLDAGFGQGSSVSSSHMESAASGRGFGSEGVMSAQLGDAMVEPEITKPRQTREQRVKAGGLGLQLGQKQPRDDLVARLAHEEHLPMSPASLPQRAAAPTNAPNAAAAVPRHVDGVLLCVNEDMKAEVERDGTLKRIRVAGTLSLTIADPDFAKIQVQVAVSDAPRGLRFQPHPKVDRGAWAKSKLLTLKTFGSGFPVGASNSVPILKWKLASVDPELCPLSLNFWPALENGRVVVNVEYTCDTEVMSLQQVSITIPCPGARREPDVVSVDGNTYFDAGAGALIWSIDCINPGDNGALDFTCDWNDEFDQEQMFPLNVMFTAERSLAGVGIAGVSHVDSQQPCKFEVQTSLNASSFSME